MPTYEITDPKTNMTLEFEGERPPATIVIKKAFERAQFEQSKGQSQTTQAKTSPEMQKVIEGMNPLQKGLVGAGYGLTNIYQGAKNAAATLGEHLGIVNPETVQNIRQERAANKEVFEPLRDQSFVAKVGEFTGETAPFMALPGGVAGSALKRAGTAALAGSLQGAILSNNPAEGAVIGAMTGGAASGTMSAASKFLNSLIGKVPMTQIQALADKWGIRTTLGETLQKPRMQKSETMLERVPVVGLQGFRKKQQEEAEVAAKEFLGKYIADPANPDFWGNKGFVDILYDNVRQLAQKDNVKIAAQDTKSAAQDMMERYPSIFESIQDKKTKGILKNIIGDTADVTQKSNILDASGKQIITTKTPEFSFEDLWQLRKGLATAKANASNNEARGVLATVNRAVDKDLETLSAKGGNDTLNALKSANEAYKTYEIKYDLLQKAYDKANGKVGAGEMFSPKKFSTELKNMIYKSTEVRRNKLFSPNEVREITGLANIMQVVKRAGQFAENPPTGNRWGAALGAGGMEGAAYIAGGAGAAVKTGGAAIGIAGIARYLTSTKSGKMLAQAASKVEPSSPQMQLIVNQIYKQIPKMAVTGVQPRAEGGPVQPGNQYLVGEQGPETMATQQGNIPVGTQGPQVIQPAQPGVIIPNQGLNSKVLTREQAIQYLDKAKGDINKARKAAIKDGFRLQGGE